jgi:hypothetical protein
MIVRASATDQNQMLIQVIDNGPGADQERFLGAFVTTKTNGMGIGLAVSRSIVEAHGAAVPDSSSFTSVSGLVKFEGTVRKPSHIDMSSDPNCKSNSSGATTEDIVAGANGSLENAVVFVADGLGDRTFQPPAQPAVLEHKGCLYRPHVVALQFNQKLNVVNSDSTTHNIHPMPANNRESNMIQPPGVPLDSTFAREEIAIPVKCNVHPWMRVHRGFQTSVLRSDGHRR